MSPAGETTETTLKHSDCVAQAASEIFSMACGVELREAQDDPSLADDGVVIAIISIVGDVDWSIFMGLPRQTAVAAAQKFAGFEIPYDSDDMGDAIGELINIIAGQVKVLLDERSVHADISLPSVMRVQGLEVLAQSNVTSSRNCWDCDLGKLWTGVVST